MSHVMLSMFVGYFSNPNSQSIVSADHDWAAK